MKKLKKYLIFYILIISIFLLTNKTYCLVEETTWNNTKKLKDVEINAEIQFETENNNIIPITITQTETNKANFCIKIASNNFDCQEITFNRDIIDTYGNVNYLYQIYFDTQTLDFNFFIEEIYYRANTYGITPGEEYVTFYGYELQNYSTNNNKYITYPADMKSFRSCYNIGTSGCYTNYNQGTFMKKLVYHFDMNNGYSWQVTNNSFFTGTGTRYRLFYSNADLMICDSSVENNTCVVNQAWGSRTYQWEHFSFNDQASNYQEIYDSGNLLYKINNFDIYFTENQNNKLLLEINQNNMQSSDLLNLKYYGKKCTNNTCYWEEIQNNSNNITLTFDYNTIGTNEGINIEYTYNVNMGDYEIIKMATIFNKEKLNNYNIHLYTLNNEYNIYTDLNYIAPQMNREEFIVDNNYLSLLVQSKNTSTSILYNVWFKSFNNWVQRENNTYENLNKLFPYAYKYNLQTSTIENIWVDTTPNNMYNGESLAYANIEIGINTALYLGMYFIDRETPTHYWVYFDTDIYYTKSNNLDWTVDYNNNTTNINTINAPSNIKDELSNAYIVDLTEIEQIIKSYYDKKEDWLNLFYSIYDPLPSTIKNILIIMYTFGCAITIIIFLKD